MLFERADPGKIERTPKIVDCISDHQGDVVDTLSELRHRVYEVLVASLEVFPDDSSATVFQKDDSNIQLRDMFIGPFNL